jgi:hypothetical protein
MTEFLRSCEASPELSEVRFRGFNKARQVWRIPLTSQPPPADS